MEAMMQYAVKIRDSPISDGIGSSTTRVKLSSGIADEKVRFTSVRVSVELET